MKTLRYRKSRMNSTASSEHSVSMDDSMVPSTVSSCPSTPVPTVQMHKPTMIQPPVMMNTLLPVSVSQVTDTVSTPPSFKFHKTKKVRNYICMFHFP